MAEAAAGIASLLASTVTIAEGATLGAGASNVTDLATLITFLTTTSVTITQVRLRTFTGDMSCGTTAVARFFFRSYSTLATYRKFHVS